MAGNYWSQGCGKMQKGIGHNPKLRVTNIAEEILFQGSHLRFLQNALRCGCSEAGCWSWRLCDRLLDPRGFLRPWALLSGPWMPLSHPSAQLQPWGHWPNLREGGRELQRIFLTIYLVARGRGDPKQCPSWGQGRNSSSLAQFGAASRSVKPVLGPG